MNYGKPFEYADEFERLMMKKSEIDSRLEFGKVQEVIVDDGDEWEGEEEMVMWFLGFYMRRRLISKD